MLKIDGLGALLEVDMCPISARRCGAKHILKSNCAKNTRFGALLEVDMCPISARRCGAKHILKSNCAKNTRFGALLEVDMCPISARRCGAKHILKSNCAKHTRFGALLEVQMSKKCTRLWREAHFRVKTLQTPHARTTFEGSDVVLRGERKGFKT